MKEAVKTSKIFFIEKRAANEKSDAALVLISKSTIQLILLALSTIFLNYNAALTEIIKFRPGATIPEL